MNIETTKFYTRALVESFPQSLYIFGENFQQWEESKNGKAPIGGGQAVIRGLPNAYGFVTLHAIGKFYDDSTFDENRKLIDKQIAEIKQLVSDKGFTTVVFSAFGLGTGRASLLYNAPLTFFYMCYQLQKHFGFNNIQAFELKQF